MTQSIAAYRIRLAGNDADILASQKLRHQAFHGFPGVDVDPFDTACHHILVERADTGRLVASCRVMLLSRGGDAEHSYTAQFYDLGPIRQFDGPVLELGRFCVDENLRDPTILRLIWARITRIVDEEGVELLFGCSSFKGNDPKRYAAAFSKLNSGHLAPPQWRPGRRARFRFAFPKLRARFDPIPALKAMPPLLRSYLTLGGRVSDHGVIDHDMGTLHVFTGVEIAAIPESRKRLLRADALA